MASFNKVILMGRVCGDPELKTTTSGQSVTSFSLAVDRKAKEGQCDFITIVAWNKTAEFICKYFKKGQAMHVCGELQTRSWTDSNGNKRTATEVVASEISFCDSKRDSEGSSTPSASNGSQGKNTGAYGYVPDAYTNGFEEIAADDSLPF